MDRYGRGLSFTLMSIIHVDGVRVGAHLPKAPLIFPASGDFGRTWRKGRIKSMNPAYRPMLATLVDEPFDDNKWVFETKWDGFRLVTEKREHSIKL